MMSGLFESGIRPVVDAHIDKLSKEVRSYGDYWSASSAGYCMRLNIMRRLGVPPVPEIAEDKARNQRVFSAGHIFHSWIQEITKDSGLSIAQELELQDEDLMVRGHIDDLILRKIPVMSSAVSIKDDPLQRSTIDHLILYDYKTVNSQSFKYKKDKISHYHRMQLGTYMYMLRNGAEVDDNGFTLATLGYGELTEARIMNISKDDLRMSEFQLLYDANLEKDVVGYWKTLNGYYAKRVLPKCTCLDHESGFMGRRSAKGKIYNDYFYNDQPCSEEWFIKCKEEGLLNESSK